MNECCKCIILCFHEHCLNLFCKLHIQQLAHAHLNITASLSRVLVAFRLTFIWQTCWSACPKQKSVKKIGLFFFCCCCLLYCYLLCKYLFTATFTKSYTFSCWPLVLIGVRRVRSQKVNSIFFPNFKLVDIQLKPQGWTMSHSPLLYKGFLGRK